MDSFVNKSLCQTHLQNVSRTFALSIEYLPDNLRHYTCLSYLLCRIPDTIEDEPSLDPTEKSILLNKYVSCFRDSEDVSEFIDLTFNTLPDEYHSKDEYWDLLSDTDEVFKSYTSVPQSIQQSLSEWSQLLSKGMNRFVTRYSDSETGGVQIQTVSEFEEYCYYVAGTVGHLLLELTAKEYSAQTTHQLYKSAREYGLFLQTINILKDVYDDIQSEGNVYIPEELLQTVGLTQTNILSASEDQLETVFTQLLYNQSWSRKNARLFLDWCKEQHPEVYSGFAIPYFLAIATQRELEQNYSLALEPEDVKISREEVYAITHKIEDDTPQSLQFEKQILEKPFVY